MNRPLSIGPGTGAATLLALLAALSGEARAVSIDWAPVGSPGNAPDTVVQSDSTTGYGSVAYAYNIGTYDVTVNQYAEFLNLKDPSGANLLGLYNSGMSDVQYGGIQFNSGNGDGSKYSVVSGHGDFPMTSVTWFDALRFANWMNNGQGNGSTESGSYLLMGNSVVPSNAATIARSAGATIFLSSENEWYKAAFFSPGMNSYFQYPTSSSTPPNAEAPPGGPNSANYNQVLGGGSGNLTNVGSYSSTVSPYGAFDMSGDAWQWNDTLISGGQPGLRGGSFASPQFYLDSSIRPFTDPSNVFPDVGFRLVEVPEPATQLLALMALAVFAWWRRRI